MPQNAILNYTEIGGFLQSTDLRISKQRQDGIDGVISSQ